MKCITCGNELTGRQKSHCSKVCASKAFNAQRIADGRLKEQRKKQSVKRKEWAENAKESRVCEACGKTFKVYRYAVSAHCSVSCGLQMSLGSCIIFSQPKFKPSRSRRLAIYERDGWICQLCIEPVNPDENPKGNWGASLDHIIPRSKGGSNADNNLRLAHRWCNSVRGDEKYYTISDLVA